MDSASTNMPVKSHQEEGHPYLFPYDPITESTHPLNQEINHPMDLPIYDAYNPLSDKGQGQ
jgi:hypothetical protein